MFAREQVNVLLEILKHAGMSFASLKNVQATRMGTYAGHGSHLDCINSWHPPIQHSPKHENIAVWSIYSCIHGIYEIYLRLQYKDISHSSTD